MKPYAFFFGYLIAALVLVLSWLLPPTKALWEQLDKATFLFLNSSLDGCPFQQVFWALTNYRPIDILGGSFMTIFFVLHILEGDSEERLVRIAQFIYALIWGEIGILLTKQCIGPYLESIDFARESPALIFPKVVMLSKAIPWLNIKDCSPCCFPGDHAAIVMQWAAFTTFFTGSRKGLLAFMWAGLFTLPRLIAGAHWLSDAFVGSAFIVLVVMAFATATPLYRYSIDQIIRYLRLWEQRQLRTA